VFVEDPRAFYTALQSIFGAGAESIVNLVGTFLTSKYGMTYGGEEFAQLLIVGDKLSRKKIREILSQIVNRKEN